MKWIILILCILPFSALGQDYQVQVRIDTSRVNGNLRLECSDSSTYEIDSSGCGTLWFNGSISCTIKSSTRGWYKGRGFRFVLLGNGQAIAVTGRSLFSHPSQDQLLTFPRNKGTSTWRSDTAMKSKQHISLEPLSVAQIDVANRMEISKSKYAIYYWRRPCWAYASTSHADGLNISVISRNILNMLEAYPFEGLPVEYENYDQPKPIW